ncbi:UPF0149 family protein [Bradyrhizobium sp. BR 1433]|uniref:UPF0149 family protein n=1 Tax=Bradyrhizobium sp. BR 1433 TaxID=3447967 RepID=UPI003EE42892
MAPGSHRSASCRRQHSRARRLCRRDRSRTGVDEPARLDPPAARELAIDADAFNHGGTPEFAAISAVALRHNDISNTLSTTPGRFEPMHRREVNGDIDPRPWCQGFYAAMRLRLSAWAPLLDAGNVNHGLLLPILRHNRDDQNRPPLGSPQGDHNAYAEILAAVEALRQYWMPIRYPRAR